MSSESDERTGDELGFGKRKAALAVGLALLLTLGAVAVIGQAADFGKLLDALRRANHGLLALTLLGELVGYAGYLVAYHTVAAADGGPRLSYRQAGEVIVLGLGAYVIGSDIGGLTVDFWAMRQAGMPLHRAARRTLALNTLQAAGLAWIATVAAAAMLALGAASNVLVFAVVWLVVPPTLTAAAAVLSGERLARRLVEVPREDVELDRRRPGSWGRWLVLKLRRVFADAIGAVVVARHVIAHPWRYLGGVAGYPLFWLGDFFILWIALRSFGYTIDPARLIVAEATAWALTFVPLPGGGAGFAEAAIAYTLHAVGVPLPQAILAALVYRAVNFWLPILPALALLPHLERLRGSLEEAERTERDEDAPVHGDAGLPSAEDEDRAQGR